MTTFFTPNLRTRILTALVLLPLIIGSMIIGGLVWEIVMAAVAVIGTLEFLTITGGNRLIGALMAFLVTLGLYLDQPVLWIAAVILGAIITAIINMAQLRMTVLGVLYVAFPVAFLVALRANDLDWLLVIFILTWGADTFAYFGGRLFGKHKLAPKISPKKTVEGAVFGVLGGFLIALLVLQLSDKLQISTAIMVFIAPFVAIIGDLFESSFKRHYNIKDSHMPHFDIIPGHGGILDRVDALLFVATFCYLYLIVLVI